MRKTAASIGLFLAAMVVACSSNKTTDGGVASCKPLGDACTKIPLAYVNMVCGTKAVTTLPADSTVTGAEAHACSYADSNGTNASIARTCYSVESEAAAAYDAVKKSSAAPQDVAGLGERAFYRNNMTSEASIYARKGTMIVATSYVGTPSSLADETAVRQCLTALANEGLSF